MSDFSDNEDYGMEYADDSGSEPEVQLENQYYSAKSLKADGDEEGALQAFQQVLDQETQKGDWGFKALKQMVKLTYKLKNFDSMLTCYGQLLTYIKSVTKNYAEKSINSILERVSISMETEFLQQFYQITLDAMMESKNDRLWFKTNTKLGKLYFDLNEFDKLAELLKELKASCQTGTGEEDQMKGTQLLEIYALEIQMYTAHKNNQAIGELYTQAINVKSAIEHPLTMGIIRECGGKMHLQNGEFDKAQDDFFEAFKSYDESGSVRRLACLKYMVLANMLMKSNINPFENQQTNQFRNEPEILAMTQLVHAYQNNDVNLFEQVLTDNYDALMDDPFIKEHIEELLGNIRSDVLMRLIKPYIKTKLNYLADELKIDQKEVIRLLIDVIHDKCQIQETALVNRGLEPIEAHLLQDMNKIGTTEK